MEISEHELAAALQTPSLGKRWQTYGKYRDSGVEWVGRVPEHWETRRLREHIALINGYPFESGLFSMVSGTPLIRIRDLITCTPETFYQGAIASDVLINKGDILVGMDGDFNVCWWNGDSALLNQRLCCLRPFKNLNGRYLYYLLSFPLKIINALTWYTTVKHLGSPEVTSIRFVYPPLPEQRAIAAFLDRETANIDALIAKKEQLIALLQEKRAALISQAVTRGLNPIAIDRSIEPSSKLDS